MLITEHKANQFDYKFKPVAIFFFIVSALEYWHGLLTLPTHVSMSIHTSTYVVGIHLDITSTDTHYTLS